MQQRKGDEGDVEGEREKEREEKEASNLRDDRRATTMRARCCLRGGELARTQSPRRVFLPLVSLLLPIPPNHSE